MNHIRVPPNPLVIAVLVSAKSQSTRPLELKRLMDQLETRRAISGDHTWSKEKG